MYTPVQNIIFVSEDELRNYIIPPNSKVLLMDREKPKFYVKTSDSLGQYTIDVYTFKKEENASTAPNQAITRSDLDNFKQEILALISTREVTANNDKQSTVQHSESDW